MAKKKISDIDLQSIIQAETRNSLSYIGSDLSQQRGENLKYYLAEPFGNEKAGRSQVVSSDVADVIEWIMPQLMRIFSGGEQAVSFEPVGPEDVEIAEQATDYTHLIWTKDNPGFINFYTWFKDALLTKNGIIKIFWDERETVKRERYDGLTEAQYVELVAADEVELVEHTQTEVVSVDPVSGMPMAMEAHDVVLKRRETIGRVKVLPVPPEEFLIDRDARTIGDARFVGHRRRRTISDLIESGFKFEDVKDLASDEGDGGHNTEEDIARDTIADEGKSQSISNEMMRQVWVVEGYLRIDADGDGIAELRQITAAGNGYKILKNEEWDGSPPFCSLTPIMMPHRFHGLAIADLIKDLQLIKSTILRQYLDNLYLQNNAREEIVQDLIVDPAEALEHSPGAKIRVKGNGQVPAIRPVLVQDIGAAALTGLEYIDRMREARTGVSERTQGLQSDSLHGTLGGERLLMSTALAKIELIARVFAETGVRDAFRMILHLITQYQDKERIVKLKNNWVPMDPRSWNPDMDVEVSVGLGTGDKEQQIQLAMQLLALQKEAAQIGLARPEHLLETAEIIVNNMGFKGVDRFFATGDEIQQQQQPQPDPKMIEVQAKIQIDQQRLEMDREKMQGELRLKEQQLHAEISLKREQLIAELQLKQLGIAAGGTSTVHVGGNPG